MPQLGDSWYFSLNDFPEMAEIVNTFCNKVLATSRRCNKIVKSHLPHRPDTPDLHTRKERQYYPAIHISAYLNPPRGKLNRNAQLIFPFSVQHRAYIRFPFFFDVIAWVRHEVQFLSGAEVRYERAWSTSYSRETVLDITVREMHGGGRVEGTMKEKWYMYVPERGYN